MSIKELPAGTCRILGSTTLIATPAILVKELVDNAIDANATTISVLVSPNTVDKVEVRDNGHGIDVADFDALGRHGHTSKIRRFEDLKTVGGSSLGFRGEGVASATTLGYVAITTRTAKEAVASTFRLTAVTGGIAPDTRKLVPAPVGTTVAVTCLFSSLPVRRKVVVQDAMKTLAAIKTLLCGYAMARPRLRLSFKVMKGVVPEWHYSPVADNLMANGTNNNIRQAVLLLFGAEVARQCQEIVASTDELLEGQSTLSQALSGKSDTKAGNFVFEACLPRHDTNVSKLKLGGFVSVDGRPLSIHHQGIAEKLLTIFHTSFGRLLMEMGSQPAKVKGTFMRLNIKCPVGTYDANVDSVKTDVLFADEKFLCDAFATLCAKTYAATAHMRYRQKGIAPPNTPLRMQPSLSLTGNDNGPGETDHIQVQTPWQGCLHDADSSPIQEHVLPLHPRISSGLTPRNQTLAGGGRPPIHQLGDMFSDPTVGAQRVPRQSGRRPVHYARHIQLLPIRKNRQKRSVPDRGMRKPPPSITGERHQGLTTNNRQQSSTEGMELPGLVSNDGFRQTTIAFGNQSRGRNEELLDVCQDLDVPTLPDSPEGASNRPHQMQSFVSARDLYRQGQAVVGPSHLTEATGSSPTMSLGSESEEPLRAAVPIPQTPPPSQTEPRGLPLYTMRVDQRRLRQSCATFARNAKAWDERMGYLSPEMADISSIKSRLRAAVMNWLARTKKDRKLTGEGALQVEFYLRKSLKKKASMVRDSGQ